MNYVADITGARAGSGFIVVPSGVGTTVFPQPRCGNDAGLSTARRRD
jgi:hypothetical protein